MESFVGGANIENSKKTFLNHVFSTTEESKAEIFNVLQYSFLGVIPVILLNKFVQRFIPELDIDKSSLEVLVEIILQIIVMFVGVIFIHRIITFVPTYSGFKYDNFVFTNIILAFFILVFSIQTKLALKTNLLLERTYSLWYGPEPEHKLSLKPRNDLLFNNNNNNLHNNNNLNQNNNINNNINNLNHNNNNNNFNNDFSSPIAANSFQPFFNF